MQKRSVLLQLFRGYRAAQSQHASSSILRYVRNALLVFCVLPTELPGSAKGTDSWAATKHMTTGWQEIRLVRVEARRHETARSIAGLAQQKFQGSDGYVQGSILGSCSDMAAPSTIWST